MVHAFPFAVCRTATLHTPGCKSPILSPLKPNGSFATFFSKVRIPCKAVDRKPQDCKATYQISLAFNHKGCISASQDEWKELGEVQEEPSLAFFGSYFM